ncbi:Divinyl chlorophyllide a 8-vinyl-reductase, chloroplastic [Ananas comosus]|uniref:Divinyl chlorophyllide a 8-vinyl-reductase, chloroplastic n=1 Tax=Ananas comosus TaxID=4615 RepID=A0A199VKV4_ANACO|nr:Divinyl chlorophyllide a 8-vinyl-reductase, chloroplastic [Ananas comosus]
MSLSSPNPLLLHHHHSHLSSLPPLPSSSSSIPNLKPRRRIKTLTLSLHSSTSSPIPTPNPNPTIPTPSPSLRSKNPSDVTVLVTGATGYIGRFVVRELLRRGFAVVAVARERSGIRGRDGPDRTLSLLSGASVVFSDVADPAALDRSLSALGRRVDAVVCCLASRSGGVRDSWKIDYAAARNTLLSARRLGAAHFVLLSAICVQKPLLEFQRAKLKFESELQSLAAADENFTFSIVRPTAFFKSLGGQVETVKGGKPYVMFGDGRLCACKPISEEDLASFIVDCVLDEDKIDKILPIGGPGKALTPLEQGEMLFRLLGREPKFLKVPIGIMDFAINVFDVLSKVFPSLEDAAEFGRIGRYYAAESMLVLDPETGEYSAEKTPSYGKDTLEDFFARVIKEGMAGQELGEQTIF